MDEMTRSITTLKLYKTFSHINASNNERVEQENLENLQQHDVLHGSFEENIFDIKTTKIDISQRMEDRCLKLENDEHFVIFPNDSNNGKLNIEYQLDLFDYQLETLLEFGSELVTNLKIAQEKQVLQRRAIEQFQYNELLQSSKNETQTTMAKFKQIQEKWSHLSEINEPMELFEELEKQKENIENVLVSKDNVIEQCQVQIKCINDKYITNQDKYSQDICCLIERIDTQVELAKSIYARHLENVQSLVNNEHNLFTKTLKDRWESMFNTIRRNANHRINLLHEKNALYQTQLKNITTQQEQITHSTRVRLEKDNEMLFLELRNTQVNAFMNSEKLDYNFLVLQKRNAENGMISSQQKRRINKLNDSIANLRDKIKTSKIHTTQTMYKLKKSINKLHSSITQLESKSDNIEIQNRLTFHRVLRLNIDELQILMKKLFEIDRILHEQLLGINWIKPEIQIININPIIKTTQRIEAQDVKRKQRRSNQQMSADVNGSQFGSLKNVLRHISDCGGVLIDQNLRKILKRYDDKDQMILRLDSILNAIQVIDMDTLKTLTDVLLPFTWCRTCSKQMPTHLQQAIIANNCAGNVQSFERYKNQYKRSCISHDLEIDSSLLMIALNGFVQKRLTNDAASAGTSRQIKSRYLRYDDMKKFWQNCRTVMPTQKIRLWRTVGHAMKHFLEILKEREKLEEDCTLLRRQNTELKYLLQNF